MKRFIPIYSRSSLELPVLTEEKKSVNDGEDDLEIGGKLNPKKPPFLTCILPADLMSIIMAYLNDDELIFLVLHPDGYPIVKYSLPHLSQDTVNYVREFYYLEPAMKCIDSYLKKNILLEELLHPLQTKKPLALYLCLNLVLISFGISFIAILSSWVEPFQNAKKEWGSLANHTFLQIQNLCTDVFLVNGTCTIVPYKDTLFLKPWDGYWQDVWPDSKERLTCPKVLCSYVDNFFDCSRLNDLLDEPDKTFRWRDADYWQYHDKHREYCARSIKGRINSCSPGLVAIYQNSCDNFNHSHKSSIAVKVTAEILSFLLLFWILYICYRYLNLRWESLEKSLPASELPLKENEGVTWFIKERIGVDDKTIGEVRHELESMQSFSKQHIENNRSKIKRFGFFKFICEPSELPLSNRIALGPG